jgi:hypothetical protein
VRNWSEWHDKYDQPGSNVSRRLVHVQRRIRDALDTAPPGPIRAVSMCAGQGRDLLGVLEAHPRAGDVTARLVESDPRSVEYARRHAPAGVEVVEGDASVSSAYAGMVPADLVLACGVFGNVPDEDVARTVRHLPGFCRPGATVVWTRHVDPPDLTPLIRDWFTDAGFREVGFDSEPGFPYGVGTHVFTGAPWAFERDVTLFRFTVSGR